MKVLSAFLFRYTQVCLLVFRGRFYIGPVCAAANTRGRDKSRPYE